MSGDINGDPIKLGHHYEDTVTGFAGVVTAHAKYLTGCDRVLLQPRATKGGTKMASAYWVDEAYCQLVLGADTEPIPSADQLPHATKPGGPPEKASR